jgi:hypothetical protein
MANPRKIAFNSSLNGGKKMEEIIVCRICGKEFEANGELASYFCCKPKTKNIDKELKIMAQSFPETAHLKTDPEKYAEGWERIFGKKVMVVSREIIEDAKSHGLIETDEHGNMFHGGAQIIENKRLTLTSADQSLSESDS